LDPDTAREEIRDYSLVGEEARLSVEKGLADASWYTSPIAREDMRALLVRKNGPAIRDTLLWFGLIFGSAFLVVYFWGTWWFILPYILYTVLYASSSDSRWHESSHGTAFKSAWLNNVLYEIASFMVLRQSTVWRWSHTRHHSDTLVRGRDPEIAAPRPPDIRGILMNFFALRSAPAEFRKIFIHASGRIEKEVATYLPESEYRKVIWKARIYLLIFAGVIVVSLVFSTLLPLMFIGLPTLVGTWLMPVYGLTQHAGLAENVLDHRLNCRTVYMNRMHRFLYWNMNYHVEHHMFPLVPYHALPKLHELMKADCPKPYGSIAEAYREIIPTLRKQVEDPSYFAQRDLPATSEISRYDAHILKAKRGDANQEGLIRICSAEQISPGEVLRFDLDERTFAIYCLASDQYYASEGFCTHGNAHLAEGLIIGEQIECPKHNGRFQISDGTPRRLPVCEKLSTYPVKVLDGSIYLDPATLESPETERNLLEFRVVSNQNVATYIKELILEPLTELSFQPGDYLKLEIPVFEIPFSSLRIESPFLSAWKKEGLLQLSSRNAIKTRRNYSLAGNPEKDKLLRFNVRIALPPPGMDCDAGIGSTYVFHLKPGDRVLATGPYGDFHVRDGERDMVYIGGGAGMAPLRSHISHLFESLKTNRKVSYWYGARSRGELFYEDYFKELESQHLNFDFQLALSEPLESDLWESHTGYIHQVLRKEFLEKTPDPEKKEYYICGPPQMVHAVSDLLQEYAVPEEQVSFDEF
jgi:MocE subfamily Rieske [2Fe-2S] domain protein